MESSSPVFLTFRYSISSIPYFLVCSTGQSFIIRLKSLEGTFILARELIIISEKSPRKQQGLISSRFSPIFFKFKIRGSDVRGTVGQTGLFDERRHSNATGGNPIFFGFFIPRTQKKGGG